MMFLAYYFLSEFAAATLCVPRIPDVTGLLLFQNPFHSSVPDIPVDITGLFPAASQHRKAAFCSEFFIRRSFDFIFLRGVTKLLFFQNHFRRPLLNSYSRAKSLG